MAYLRLRCINAHLLIGHELNSRFWGNFDDIDAIASPQWPHTALTDHLGKAPSNMHAFSLGGVNLGRQDKQSACILFSSSLPSVQLIYNVNVPLWELAVKICPHSWAVLCVTCMSTLSLSSGAVHVRDTAPAPPPATRCRHHIPVCFSSAVNSSGTIKLSPTSKICGGNRGFQPGDTVILRTHSELVTGEHCEHHKLLVLGPYSSELVTQVQSTVKCVLPCVPEAWM